MASAAGGLMPMYLIAALVPWTDPQIVSRMNLPPNTDPPLTWQASHEMVEIVKAHELDLPLRQDLAHGGITQGAQLGFPFVGIAGLKVWIDVPWMAAQFGKTFLDLGFQHPQQTVHADLLEVCGPTPLAIELREVTGRGVFPQRQPVLPRQVSEMGQQPWVPVHVAVRVQMRWRTADQLLKAAELTVQLRAASFGVGAPASE